MGLPGTDQFFFASAPAPESDTCDGYDAPIWNPIQNANAMTVAARVSDLSS